MARVHYTFQLAVLAFMAVPLDGAAKMYPRNSTTWVSTRRYVEVPRPSDADESDVELLRFRVMTFNILCQTWVMDTPRTRPLWGELGWRTRKRRIFQEIVRQKPDIITMQEVEGPQYHSEILPFLASRGYAGRFCTFHLMPVGNAIFWKTDKFELQQVSLGLLTDPIGSRWFRYIHDGFTDEQQTRYLVTTPKTFILAVLSVKDMRHALVVGTTHLKNIDGNMPTEIDIQTFQGTMLLEALSYLVEETERKLELYDGVSVLLAGDFNAPPQFPKKVKGKLMQLVRWYAAEEAVITSEELVDEKQDCVASAQAGQCQDDPLIMLQSCAKSCVEVAGISRRERLARLCDLWATEGRCGEESPEMAVCGMRCASRDEEEEELPEGDEFLISPVYELATMGRFTEETIGFLVLAIKASGLHPSAVLPSGIFMSFWQPRPLLQSANAVALGYEPATWLDETLDFIFFAPGGAAPGSSHLTCKMELLGVVEPPPPLSFAELIRGGGSDHVPVIADFALMAPKALAASHAAARRVAAAKLREAAAVPERKFAGQEKPTEASSLHSEATTWNSSKLERLIETGFQELRELLEGRRSSDIVPVVSDSSNSSSRGAVLARLQEDLQELRESRQQRLSEEQSGARTSSSPDLSRLEALVRELSQKLAKGAEAKDPSHLVMAVAASLCATSLLGVILALTALLGTTSTGRARCLTILSTAVVLLLTAPALLLLRDHLHVSLGF